MFLLNGQITTCDKDKNSSREKITVMIALVFEEI